MVAAVPLDEEFYTAKLPEREKVFKDDFKDWQPYKEPPKPSFNHLKNGYLKKLVKKYENV